MAQECRRWRDFNCVRYMQRLHGVVFMILHSLVEKSGKDILIESMFVEKCPVTGGALTLPDRTFFAEKLCIRRISKLHPVLFVWGGWAPRLLFLLRVRKRWFLLPGWKVVHGFCLRHEVP